MERDKYIYGQGRQGGDENENAIQLVEFFETMQRHLSIISSRSAICGFSNSISTIVKDGIPGDYLLDKLTNESLAGKLLNDSSHTQSFLSSFEEHRIPLVTTFSSATLCNQSSFVFPDVKGRVSHASWCNNTLE